MALILTDYDLSGGKTTTSEVASPNNWRVTATVTDANARDLTFFLLEIEDEEGNWAVLRDDSDKSIQFFIKGNGTESRNVVVTNAANGRVRVSPSGIGTVNIDSINA